MSNTKLLFQTFADVFINEDHRLKLWIYQAEFHLRKKTSYRVARYYTGKDIVMDVIAGILTERIKWDPDKVPNLNTFMYTQIRGHVSNIAKKELHRMQPAGFRMHFDSDDAAAEFIPRGESTDEIASRQDYEELRKRILSYFEKDVLAYFVLEESISGCRDKEIAETLGILKKEVLTAKKRIRRVINQIRPELLKDFSL